MPGGKPTNMDGKPFPDPKEMKTKPKPITNMNGKPKPKINAVEDV